MVAYKDKATKPLFSKLRFLHFLIKYFIILFIIRKSFYFFSFYIARYFF